MNAKRCNRCLGYYVPEEEKGDTAEIKEIFYHNGEDILSTRFSERESGIDLCTECTADFRKFMEGCGLAIRDNDFDRPDITDPLA